MSPFKTTILNKLALKYETLFQQAKKSTCRIINSNTVGTPYNTNDGVQKIPDRAIWKPMVAKRNNTNP